jgi:hypothetical protein
MCIEPPGITFSCIALAMPFEDTGPACADLDQTACAHRHDCRQNTTFNSDTRVSTWSCSPYTGG